MRKVIAVVFILLFSAAAAQAEWQVDFEDTYFSKGIDQAVIDALKDGAQPDSIVEIGLSLEGLNPQNLIMALYCAGAGSQDIRDAAASHAISEMIVTAGYKKSVVECGDAVADSQAYTPVSTGFSSIPGSRGSSVSASPSTF